MNSSTADGVRAPVSTSAKALQAVLLNLFDQVRKFCEEQGEADFETGAAEAMRRHIRGMDVPEGLQRQLDALLHDYGVRANSETSFKPVTGGGTDGR